MANQEENNVPPPTNKDITKKENTYMTPTSAIRRLTFDRIVLAHFFVLFLISFAIGVLFLHSMFTLSAWGTQSSSGEALEKVLTDLGVNQIMNLLPFQHGQHHQLHQQRLSLLKAENVTVVPSHPIYGR